MQNKEIIRSLFEHLKDEGYLGVCLGGDVEALLIQCPANNKTNLIVKFKEKNIVEKCNPSMTEIKNVLKAYTEKY